MREVKKAARHEATDNHREHVYIDETIKKQCTGTLCESSLSSVQICW